MRRLASTILAAVALAVPALAVTAPAQADPDTDFYNELHSYGIYGEKDYNAWIGKITCKRLRNNLDHDAYASAKFIRAQLNKNASTEQTWQFLSAALRTYCPDKLPILQQVAQGSPAPQQPPAPAGPPLAAEQ